MKRLLLKQFTIGFITISLAMIAFAWICPMAISKMDTMQNQVMTQRATSSSSCISQTTHDTCALAFAKQIAHMQQTVFASTQIGQLLSVLFACAAMLLVFYLAYITTLLLLLYQRFIKDNPDIKECNFLIIAFSKGLIHPKIYI